MKKLKNTFIFKKLNNNRFVLLSGACAAVIVLLVYFCYDVSPFGDMTILRMDLYHQYGPLFGELFERLKNLDSLLYSWKSGLGGNFLGNYFNYLSSPLTPVILLFGHKRIPQAIATLLLLKTVFGAGSFTYYLKKTFNKHDFATAGFGLLYVFCGWYVAYYWNIMWVDALALMPLVILGVQYIIDKGKPWLYCISLAVTLFANYYMGYMICIFSVLYFIVYYFSNYSITDGFVNKYKYEKTSFILKLKNSRLFRSGVRFALFSLLGAALTAVSLVPLYFALKACSATSGSFPVEYKSYFKIFDFLANHIAGIDPTIRSSGDVVLPNVYCGMLTVMLVPLYLFNGKFSIKEKAMHIGLLLVMLLSMNINYANYVWHGFHFPNDLPYRFSFMYSFILLIMAFKAFSHIKDYSAKNFLAVGIAVMGFIVLVEKIESKNVTELAFWISIAFTGIYTLIITLFKNKNYSYTIVALLLLCTCGSEIAVANTNNYSMGQSHTNYTADYNDFYNIYDMIKENDDSFFRMEQSKLLTRMDDSWYYYNGTSVFSSLANERLSNTMRDLGMMGNYINSFTYYPQTAVFNAMFDVKYILDNDHAIDNSELYEDVCGNDTYFAYKNKYVLPVAFGVNSDVKDWHTVSTTSPFELQSDWFYLSSGVEDVFENIPIEYVSYNNIIEFYPDEIASGSLNFNKEHNEDAASVTIEIVVPKDENVYIYLKSRNVKSVTISGEFTEKTQNMDNNFNIIDLGYRTAGESIFIQANIPEDKGDESVQFFAAGLNIDNFIEGYEILNENSLKDIDFKETDVKGKVNMKKDGIMFTSIPYDEGWTVYVDGKKTEYFAISDAFLAFDISNGEHTVEFKFMPKGLLVGVGVSAVTLFILLIIAVYLKKSKNKWWDYDNSADELKSDGFRLIETTVYEDLE
ncbi:MAG: YfhO family protein [Clostridia bacterium]|nr:YfhO family protein [Clostridia bacterium]